MNLHILVWRDLDGDYECRECHLRAVRSLDPVFDSYCEPRCTQDETDSCADDPALGMCGVCGYVYHDIPRATDDAHGELCPLVAQHTWAAQRWDQPSLTARVDAARQQQVERQRIDRTASNIAVRARDCGLVPHAESRKCATCVRQSRTNMLAASLLRYRYTWRSAPGVYAQTLWAEAAYATRDL